MGEDIHIAMAILKDVADNLRAKSNWHRLNHNDPYEIDNAVLAALEETADAIEKAIAPKPKPKADNQINHTEPA